MTSARTLIAGALLGGLVLAGAGAPVIAQETATPAASPSVKAKAAKGGNASVAKDKAVAKQAVQLEAQLLRMAKRYEAQANRLAQRAAAETDSAMVTALVKGQTDFLAHAATATATAAKAKGAKTKADIRAAHKDKVALNKAAAKTYKGLGLAGAAAKEAKAAKDPVPSGA
jgi:hypothetical protein